MASNYRIKLGVQLVTKGLRSELNKIGEKPIKVKVELSTKGLRTQLNEVAKKPIKAKVQLSTRGLNTQIGKDIKPVKIKLDTSQVQRQINNLKSQIQSLGKVKINLGGTSSGSSKGSKSGAKGAVNEMNWAYKQMLDIQKKANSLSLKINGLDTSKNVNELKELSLQFARLRSDYETLKKAFGGKLSTTQLGNLQAEITETDAKLSVMDAKIADTRAKLARGIEINFKNSKFSAQVEKVKGDAQKLSNVSNELKAEMKHLDVAMKSIGNAVKTGNIEKMISSYKKYESVLKSVENQLKRNKAAQQSAAYDQALKDDRSLFQTKIDAWLRDNSKAVKRFGADMRNLRSQAESCDRVTLNHLKKEFMKIDRAAEAAGKRMQTFSDRLRTQFSKYMSYFSISSIFMYGTMALRDMFEQVVAIDTAMTELKKVTNETDSAYSNFLTNASERASEIGTTIDGLVTSTAGFARLGYGFDESQRLAEIANIYAVVGDEVQGVEGATKSLISTMAAFYEESSGLSKTEFAEDAIDKFNEIGNNFAISSGGIGEALQRSASSLFAANNTLDESIALITAANTVVQDPDVVGTALKTVSMRVRGAKTEMEEAGLETEGMAESTAKLRAELLALSGVDIMLDKNTFKSTYQIMEELAAKWENLTDIQQASVTELIAGRFYQYVQKCA